MKNIFIRILLFASLGLSAKNYYISNSGNDNNDGLTHQTAWRSLDKVNLEMYRFRSGDIIYFEGGNKFYGNLLLKNINGSNGSPITLTSYGTGQAKIIGAKDISGWTKLGNNIWSASTSGDAVYQVFKSESVITNARIPKVVDDYAGTANFARVSSGNSNTTFLCEELSTLGGWTIDLTGATCHMQSEEWRSDASIITSHNVSTGEIVLAKSMPYIINAGDSFFINNHEGLLTQQDDWFYSEGVLKYYSTAEPTNILAATNSGTGITAINSDYIVVDNLEVSYFDQRGIYYDSCNNSTISNNTLNYNYNEGIRDSKGSNGSTLNNYVKGSNNAGIVNGNTNALIKGNTITDIGVVTQLAVKGFEGNSFALGFNAGGQYSTYKQNTLNKIGYNGFHGGSPNLIIEENLIQDWCLTLHDGGAIYSYAGVTTASAIEGSIIRKNIILGYEAFTSGWLAEGIYMDSKVHDVTIDDNTITGCKTGIFYQNSKNITGSGNNIYNTSGFALLATATDTFEHIYGNKFFNNRIYSQDEHESLIYIKSHDNDFNYVSFDKNKYFNPFNHKSILVKSTEINNKEYDLEDWNILSGEDANSVEDKLNWNSFEVVSEISTLFSFDFNKGIDGFSGYKSNISRVDQGNSEYYLNVEGNSWDGAAKSSTFIVKSGKTYLLEFKASSSSKGECKILINKSGSPYTTYATEVVKTTPEWKSYQIKFECKVDVNDMSIFLRNSVNTPSLRVKNVSFKEVKLIPAKERSKLLYNTNNDVKSFSLPNGVWQDLDGNFYNGSLTLQPFKSLILLLSNEKFTAIKANAGEDQTICHGESVTLEATGGSSYLWSNGEISQSIRVSPTETQTYSVTVIEGNESASDDVTVTVNSVIADAGDDRTIVEGESVTLVAKGGDTYLWSNGATTATIKVSPNASVSYSVKATKGNCNDTDDVKVTVNPLIGGISIIANVGEDQTICHGESVILEATGGSSYLWSNGETSQSISVSPSETKTYTVTVTQGSESASDDVTVKVNSVTADAGTDRSIIEGETITLVANGGDSYLWSTGAKTKSINVRPGSTKKYTVIAYKGNCQDSDELTVNVEPIVDSDPPPAVADAGEDITICLGNTIKLNGSGGNSYVWSNGETTPSINVSPTRTTTYELKATRGGVTNSDSVTITVENCLSDIDEDEQDLAILEMNIYPNPTHGELFIRINNLEDDSNIIINDAKGSTLFSDLIYSSENITKQIDLKRFESGIYFVQLTNQNNYIVKKLVLL